MRWPSPLWAARTTDRCSCGGLLQRFPHDRDPRQKVGHVHGLVWIVRAVFIANEDHRARDALIGEYRGIMAGAARDFLVRQAETTRDGFQPTDPLRVHDSGGRFQSAVKPEFYPTFITDQPAFREEKVVERLKGLLALAPQFEAETQESRDAGNGMLAGVG